MLHLIEGLADDWHRLDERIKSSRKKRLIFAKLRCARTSTFQVNGAAGGTGSDYDERASALLTDLPYQRPPRAVATAGTSLAAFASRAGARAARGGWARAPGLR